MARGEGFHTRQGGTGNTGKDQIGACHVKDSGLHSEIVGKPLKGFLVSR